MPNNPIRDLMKAGGPAMASLMVCMLLGPCFAAFRRSADPAKEIANLMSVLYERGQFCGAELFIICSLILEARVGIEPTHKGFADLSLTTWVPRLVKQSLLFPGLRRKRLRLALRSRLHGAHFELTPSRPRGKVT